MKLRDEHLRSYIDNISYIGLLDFLTWKGQDVAPAWVGAYEPATRSDDAQLAAFARFSRAHYLFYRALVERHMEKEGVILDVGCGSGARTAMLARYAKQVVALDPSMSNIAIGGQLNTAANINWVLTDFQEWTGLPNGEKFDYVFCVEVIEHIELRPQKDFMKALIAQVKPGGALFLTTPRDNPIDRREPHIGLWDDDIAEVRTRDVAGVIEYFNVNLLKDGGADPWSPQEGATHYVVVAKP